jgi:hypothetical protein
VVVDRLISNPINLYIVNPDAIRRHLNELSQSLDQLPEPTKEQSQECDYVESKDNSGVDPEEVRDSLTKMRQRFESLPETKEPPSTTLQVLGRSRRESFWQRFLVYFLNPQGSHRLDEDVLERFLTAISNRPDTNFSFSRLHLQEVRIEEEVSTGKGRPDAVIWSGDEWFICIEIKVNSSEGKDQTERYVSVDSFESIDLDKSETPEDRQHYIYIAPEDAPQPEADEFTLISWEFVASELRSFIADSYGEYPSRTVAQMNDFIDTVRSELIMTEYQENQREKIALAIEHYEPMKEVLEELENHVEDLQQEWPDWFVNQSPEGWDDGWRTLPSDNTYMNIIRDEWAIGYSEGMNVKEADLCAYWQFRVADEYVGLKQVDYSLSLTGVNDELLSSFRDSFYSEGIQEELREKLAELNTHSRKEAQLNDWRDSHTYKTLVDGVWRFEENDIGTFEETVAESFEDLQPIFGLVTESIPEK